MMLKTQVLAAAVAVVLTLTPKLHADLVAYYAFEDTGGGALLADSSGLGNNLSSTGLGVTTTTQFLGISSITLNGATQEASISMASFTELQSATNAFTVTGWFRPNDDSAADDDIFYAGDATTQTDVMFRVETRQSLDRVRTFTSQDGTTQNEIESADLSGNSLDTWTFYAFVWDSGTGQNFAGLQTDGDLTAGLATLPGYTTLNTANGVFKVGRATDSTSFAGAVDEVAVFNEALSAAQIEALFDGGKGGLTVTQIIPEPASLVLLGLGGGLMLLRRRGA